jgi:hypothetical protein
VFSVILFVDDYWKKKPKLLPPLVGMTIIIIIIIIIMAILRRLPRPLVLPAVIDNDISNPSAVLPDTSIVVPVKSMVTPLVLSVPRPVLDNVVSVQWPVMDLPVYSARATPQPYHPPLSLAVEASPALLLIYTMFPIVVLVLTPVVWLDWRAVSLVK